MCLEADDTLTYHTICCHASMSKGMNVSPRLSQNILWEWHRKQGQPRFGPGALLQHGIGPLDDLHRRFMSAMPVLLQTRAGSHALPGVQHE